MVRDLHGTNKIFHIVKEGSSISRQNFNENLETLHLAPTLFYYLPGFLSKNRMSKSSSFILDKVKTYKLRFFNSIKYIIYLIISIINNKLL